MTSKQLQEENMTLVNNNYRMLKKYTAIRQICKTLAVRNKAIYIYVSSPYNIFKGNYSVLEAKIFRDLRA